MCTSPLLIHTRSSVRSDRLTGLSVIQEASPSGLYRTIRANRSSSNDAVLKCYSKLRSASDDFSSLVILSLVVNVRSVCLCVSLI